jgi:hypothetical protein
MVYVDVDWRERDDADAEPIGIAVEDGKLFWTDSPDDSGLVTDVDGVAQAAELLGAYADAIASLIDNPVGVEIVGEGALAHALERRFGGTQGTTSTAIILLSANEGGVAQSLERLEDLGLLVLAAPGCRSANLDFYPHLHRRGLRMVGVPRPSPAALTGASHDRERVEALVSALQEGAYGTWMHSEKTPR